MFALLVVFLLNNEIKTIQVDGFRDRAACERAYNGDLVMPLSAIALQSGGQVTAVCIAKE